MAKLVALLLLGLLGSALAEYDVADISDKSGFAFLGKFCYDWTPEPAPTNNTPPEETWAGLMSVRLLGDVTNPPTDLQLLLYDDQPESWPQVYGGSLSCADKVQRAKVSYPVVFQGGEWQPLAGTIVVYEHRRPRFWYVVLANCRSISGVAHQSRFINKGSNWNKEFGVNEQGLNTLYVVYFVFFTLMLALHLWGVRDLWRTNSFHPIVRLLTAALFLEMVAMFCEMVHYVSWVNNGFGVPPIHGMGQLMFVSSHLCFFLLLILIAKGWTITTTVMPERKQLYIAMGLFIVAYFVLLLWDVVGRDPASTLYVYESIPGIIIILLNVAAGAWFVYSIYLTHQVEIHPDKKQLYKRIGFAYAGWFLTLGILVAIAAGLDPWVREKTVTTLYITSDFFFYAIMCYLLWPSHASMYFQISGPDVSGLNNMGTTPYEEISQL